MSYNQKIRAAIKATLEKVPNSGVIHEYERFSKDPKSFSAMYLKNNALLGWHIRRLNISEQKFSSMYNRVTITWRIRGFAGLVDGAGSELVFDELIDNIRAAFRRLPVLCDQAGEELAKTVVNGQAGVQVQNSEPVMFAGVLAHRVTLALTTEHLEEIEPVISDFAELGENITSGEAGQTTPKPCPNGGAFNIGLCLSPSGDDFKIKTEEQDNE